MNTTNPPLGNVSGEGNCSVDVGTRPGRLYFGLYSCTWVRFQAQNIEQANKKRSFQS